MASAFRSYSADALSGVQALQRNESELSVVYDIKMGVDFSVQMKD